MQKLCAFGKTQLIQPGEEETVAMEFRISDFAPFDEKTNSYVLEKGTYYIRLGTDSRNTTVCGAVYRRRRLRRWCFLTGWAMFRRIFSEFLRRAFPPIPIPAKRKSWSLRRSMRCGFLPESSVR